MNRTSPTMSTNVQELAKAHYLRDLARISPNNIPQWAHRIRETGAGMFNMAEFPNTKMEEFRHTQLSAIVNTPYVTASSATPTEVLPCEIAPWSLGDGSWAELVFVNGYFCPALSNRPKSCAIAGAVRDAMLTNHSILEAYLGRYLQDRNAFTALNSAFLRDGALLHVPRGKKLEAPVHFLFIRTHADAPTAAHLRNLIVLEENAEASVVATYLGFPDAADYFNNIVEEIHVGPNASLKLYKRVHEGPQGKHLCTAEIHQDRDARLDTGVFTFTGEIVRNQLCIALAGEGASASVQALYLNDGRRTVDNHFDLRHQASHGASRIFARGVLDGESHAIFRGHVYVAPEAQKTDSNQLNNNMLLSNEARIDTKPQLEIFADDVKCTHGSTTGGPNAETLFYFRSRGIAETAARAMLTRAFANAVVDTVPVEPLREALRNHISERY